MNLKDIFTEYARKQRELCAENAILFKDWKVELGGENIGSGYEYSVDKSSILNAPEPPLPSFWTKEKPEPQECLLVTALKIGKGWLYNIYEIEKIDTRDTCYWIVWDGGEWEDYHVLRADLYMILPGVQEK